MKMMHTVAGRTIGVAMLCMVAFGATASAQGTNETVVTFHGAVRLPNATLAPGTYRFSLPAWSNNQDIAAVYNSRNEFITLARVTPMRRAHTGPSVVVVSSAPASTPKVSALYFAGSHSGYEFVYPRPAVTLLADRTR